MSLIKVKVRGTDNVSGRRNLVINGAMQVAQRGTTSSALGHGSNQYHTVDRWSYLGDQDQGSGTLSTTFSQVTDVPASETFVNSLKAVVSSSGVTPSGSDCIALFQQQIETFNANPLGWGTAAAKPATLSYWIKSSVAGTGTLQLRLNDSSSVSGASDGNYYTKFTINQADTWEKKTHLIPANTTDGWRTTVTASAIQIYWFFGSNQAAAATQDAWFRQNNYGQKHSDATFNFQATGGTAYITGCQLEVGESASDFEHRSFVEELAICKRYYEKSFDYGATPGVSNYNSTENWSVNGDGSGNAIISPSFKVEKRAASTMVAYRATGQTGSWDYQRNGATSTGGVTFDRIGTNTTRCYTGIGANWASASLFGHWTADAEL